MKKSQRTVLRALLNVHNVDRLDPRAVEAFFAYTDRGVEHPCLSRGWAALEDWEKQARELYSAHKIRAFDYKLWSEYGNVDTVVFVEDLRNNQPELVLQIAQAVDRRYDGFLGRHWEALLHLHGIYRMPDGSLQIVEERR